MRVIARAYADRPLDRVIVEEGANVTYLAAETVLADSASGVGFPKDCVFEFDAELYASLVKAWETGERDKLNELWSHAHQVGPGAKVEA